MRHSWVASLQPLLVASLLISLDVVYGDLLGGLEVKRAVNGLGEVTTGG